MTTIAIDPDSKIPPYEQIKAAVIEEIATGRLATDHKLPTIRQLAGDLDVAPNTVARAYRELEADGLIRSRGRRGTIVLARQRDAAAVANPEIDAITAAISRARERGLTSGDILHVVTQALASG